MAVNKIQWGPISPPLREGPHYDHVIGITPLGRVLITWKGWKEMGFGSGAPTIDEMPGHEYGIGNGGYNTPQEAMGAAQAEFDRLIGACITADNLAEPTTDLAQALHQRNELADTLGRCVTASGMLRPDIDGLSGPQLLQFGDELAEMLAQRVPRAGPVLLPADRQGRVYVAGPMSNLPEFNFPAFFAAETKLVAEGWDVENPAQHGVVGEATWEDYMLFDLGRLVTCEALYLLPGWSKSRGASLEVHIARQLGLRIRFAPGAEPEVPLPDEAGIYTSVIGVDDDGFTIAKEVFVAGGVVKEAKTVKTGIACWARPCPSGKPGRHVYSDGPVMPTDGGDWKPVFNGPWGQTLKPCVHHWVDARNKYVTSGEVCTRCGAMRAGNEGVNT